jgi:hypothetical protein
VHQLEEFEKENTNLDDLIIIQVGYQSLNTNTIYFLKQFFVKKSILIKNSIIDVYLVGELMIINRLCEGAPT